MIVTLTTAERQVIVSRNVLTVRVLCVIIELHVRKRSHQIRIRDTTHFDFDVLPAYIARQVETNSGSQSSTCCLTHSGFDILHHVTQEVISIFEEALRLRNTGRLHVGHCTLARSVEAGSRASGRRRGTDLISADTCGSKVQSSRMIPEGLALHELGIHIGKHHISLLRRCEYTRRPNQ